MAYVSGTAATFAELVTGIRNACTANGWTLNGETLIKGDIYQRVYVYNSIFVDSYGGTGISGGIPTGPSPSAARIGNFTNIPAFSFPVAYEVFIHTDPDEVFVVVNTTGAYYQWLAFGKSSVALPGTGSWHSGSFGSGVTIVNFGISIKASVSPSGVFGTKRNDGSSATGYCPAMFWALDTGNANGEHIHTGLNGSTWEGNLKSSIYRAPLNAITPNTYNNQAVLLPIQVFSTIYGSGKVALVLDVAHCRSLSIANLNPGEIITLGADRWKVFPWYLKSATEGNGTSYKHGFAVRYDGP